MINNKVLRQTIYEKLNVASVTNLLANGSASLYHAVAPSVAQYPLLIFFESSGVTIGRFGGEAYKDTIWTVKGVARNTKSGEAEDIDKAVFDVLQHVDMVIPGAEEMIVSRQSDVQYVETQGDTQFRHCGGMYRIAYY